MNNWSIRFVVDTESPVNYTTLKSESYSGLTQNGWTFKTKYHKLFEQNTQRQMQWITLTLKRSLEGGLLLDRILGENQNDRQMTKDHEKPANTMLRHRPAMYMHVLASTEFTVAFHAVPTNFSFDQRLTRVHRRERRTLGSTTLPFDLPNDSTNKATAWEKHYGNTRSRATLSYRSLRVAWTIRRHSVKYLGGQTCERNSKIRIHRRSCQGDAYTTCRAYATDNTRLIRTSKRRSLNILMI